MALTGVYGHVDRREAVRIVRRGLDLGVTHFDTADLYGPYVNEELLGDALGADTHRVSIATKFGYRIEKGRIAGVDSRPQSIRPKVQASLRRLRRDAVDLLYQHRPDPDVPVEDVVGAMSDLVREGLVRSIGLSGTDTASFQRAGAVHPIAAVQNEYSLLSRAPEKDLLDVVGTAGARFVAYAPLGRGRLAGSLCAAGDRAPDDYRARSADFSDQSLNAIAPVLAVLADIASIKGATVGAVAIAWLLAKRPHVMPIPGARSVDQLDIIASASAMALSSAEMARLSVVGPRAL
jgi:aryl-alcohol dehydrogenase-like predicted oxidoreductase